MSYTLQNTNSFELSVTSERTIAGGEKGGVFLGGTQSDRFVIGSGNALAAGGDGNDSFTPGIGKQYLLGDNGVDTIVYTTARLNHSLTKEGAGYTVSDLQGTQTLVDVERLQFADSKVAIDTSENQAAGQTALILGACLGANGLSDKAVVGTVLSYFDAGYTMSSISDLLVSAGITAQLSGGADNMHFVDWICTNILGAPPTAAVASACLDFLNQGVTQGQFLAAAAVLDPNQQHIGLVGLQQTGIEYV
jgi:hypothetical protein